MLKTPELLKNECKKMFGTRVDADWKCVFCGAELERDEYCFCTKAQKVNRYFKKAHKKISDFGWFEVSPELEKDAFKSRIKMANIPEKFQGDDFEDYKEDTPADKKVKSEVMSYFKDTITNFLKGKNLILVGKFGTGKTKLMAILTTRIILDYLFKARYVNGVDLINKIQDTYSNANSKVTTLSILNEYKDCDFLFIDDIDKINATPDARKLIYSIINDRVERELPTIISANSAIEELDENFFGEAIVSRFVELSTVVIFTQKNRRIA